MPNPDEWTIGRLLTWTTDYLKQHGSDSPRLDAEVLLAEARRSKRIELYTAFNEVADEVTRTAFRELVRRCAEGAPVAYLVGRREFYSLNFRVSPDVLIPRPETELIVMRIIELAKNSATPVTLADIGTGSGIIAITAARHIPTGRVTAIDSSPAALEIARSNATDLKVADRIEFLESDLFAAVPSEQRFNIIASNPPYVSEAEFAKLPPTVRDYEPRNALVAGERGTEVIQRLIPQAAERLQPDGWLLMEISPMIETAVRDLVTKHGGYELGPTIKDAAGQPRVIQAQRTG